MMPQAATAPSSDMELIEAFRRGERAAAEVLAQRYYRKVYNTCLRYLNSPEDSRDISQEIFMKILVEKKILKFRGQAQLWTWLYRVTANTCQTWLLRRRRTRTQCMDDSCLQAVTELQAASTADPEKEFQARQKYERLHQMLLEMPAHYRQVLHLVYWEGYSYREAAARLKIKCQYLGVLLLRSKLWLSKRGKAAGVELYN